MEPIIQNNKVLKFICETFKQSKSINTNKYNKIKFPSTKTCTDRLHPDTKSKFINFYSIHLTKGIYGPIYRYCPDMKNLRADNETGGYFTNLILECEGCIKRKLWLYDKNRNYYYRKNNRDLQLYRFECYFNVKDEESSIVFIGEVAFGNAIQVRPTNWLFGNKPDGKKNKNVIIYNKKPFRISKSMCIECSNTNFFNIFENK